MKRKQKLFTDSFKLKVAREYMETELSQVELLKKYDIRGSSSITNWVRKFGLVEEPVHKRINRYSNSIMGKEISKEEKALRKRIKELEKQLDYEKLRSNALDTMIKIAEDKFDIPIRKKSGTKQ